MIFEIFFEVEKAPPPAEPPIELPPKESCCYLCSIPTPKDNMQRIALEKNQQTIKSLPEIPVFSVLGKHKAPRGAVMEGPHQTLGKSRAKTCLISYFFLTFFFQFNF